MQRPEPGPAHERRYVLVFALLCGLLAVLPNLYALIAAPPGSAYLGYQWATDDQMVYAAWMRQAMDGAFFFDNRFTIDPQPGLTIHLYFFVLGQVARIVGIAFASALARFVLSAVFVWLAYGLIRRLTQDTFTIKLSLALTVFGGGLGFLVWHRFGDAVTLAVPDALSQLLYGKLPTDVWQPEGFVFPSMLTTSLFMAALCLIIVVFTSVIDARTSWRPVVAGSLAMFALMNIHSYDVLLIAMVLIGFLVTAMSRRQVTGAWALRAAAIGAGAVPPALWFMHVLNNDPVFQSRAATDTASPNFRQVFFGYALLIGLAITFAFIGARVEGTRKQAGAVLLSALVAALFFAASTHTELYWMGMAAWLGLFAVCLVILALLADDDPWRNLLWSWAVIGLIAPYYPDLFQRKLAMGLVVPWAILGSFGLARIVSKADLGRRNLVAILGILATCASSFFWIRREKRFIDDNVSRTAVHPVYLHPDVVEILDKLNERAAGRTVLLAMPGVWAPAGDEQGNAIPDMFLPPVVPDLNPIASGLAGVYTYAGHWSETPDYLRRRGELTSFFLDRTPDSARRGLLEATRADYILAPVPGSMPGLGLADVASYGEVVAGGGQFQLIKVRPDRAR